MIQSVEIMTKLLPFVNLRSRFRMGSLWLLSAVALLLTTTGAGLVARPGEESFQMENESYYLRLLDSGAVELKGQGTDPWVFQPRFTVIFSQENPQPAFRHGLIEGVPYPVVTWEAQEGFEDSSDLVREDRDMAHFGDGFDDSIMEGDVGGRTANVFSVAPIAILEASSAEISGDRIVWTFPDRSAFSLKASVYLPEGIGEPKVSFTFRPKVDGYFSISYTGAPSAHWEEVDEVWQPLIWHEKRFPHEPILTLAFRCPLPTAFVTLNNDTLGVVADPVEIPFQPLPTRDNSRFGVAVRNADGMAQPLLFAPALGGFGSQMKADDEHSFAFRLFVANGGVMDAFEQLARGLYGFHDYRRNAIGSLNETLDNMIDYGMSDYSFFDEKLKGCSYATDVPDAVKNVSSLNPLNIALLTGRSDIFERRAYPILEYLLSREKFLFSLDPEQRIQFPSRAMTGPSAPVTELAELYSIFNERSPVFLHLAREMTKVDRILNLDVVNKGDSWHNFLALYRAGGDPADLERAKRGADELLERRVSTVQTGFTDPDAKGFVFWTGYTPRWIDLMELYEETGEYRYLQAAWEGARYYATLVWMAPAIPDVEVVVNEGGEAPVYWYLASRTDGPIQVPEERVPAWRVSEIGLTPESSVTSPGHRGIFMTNYAPWMLRLGGYTGDEFLKDIAKSAVIGRYLNFPGYHMNTARTTVYEKPDYPLRPYRDLSYNSFHFNHIWPHMSIVFDYLVTDAEVRSEGGIRFPSRFIEGYAYLQSKFYGDRPGTFYGEEDAILWMPQRLLELNNVELNYIAARGNDSLYLAFTNQSPEPVLSSVRLNEDALGHPLEERYMVDQWVNNRKSESFEMADGRFDIEVPGDGILAVAICGMAPESEFQRRILDYEAELWANDYLEGEFGDFRAMLLNLGEGMKSAFIYLQAADDEFDEVTLHYETNGGAGSVVKDAYPYEFTVSLSGDADEVRFRLEGALTAGGRAESAEYFLTVGK